MNFASRDFFVFLPIVLAGYHLLRRRDHKYRFLLAASWVFYLSWNPWCLPVLLVSTALAYGVGLRIDRAASPRGRRGWLVFGVTANVALLAFFKYTNFLAGNVLALARAVGWPAPELSINVLLPLGISFFTFHAISYVADVYRGDIPAVRSFTDFALYFAFFPHLVAGPIVRATELVPQMATPPRVGVDQFLQGLHWFLVGLFKKVFLADRLGQFVDPVFADPGAFDAWTQRWAVIAYAAQIYCDFSGYTDLAVGCARWFGFELPQNFNFPYLAESITDFWRRWHMTLGRWIKDYLYIPLGGNRQGPVRTYVNLTVAMTLCGLWHGANWNYLLWGLYNGVLLSLHRLWDRALTGRAAVDAIREATPYRLFALAATLLQVLAGLILVRTDNWGACWTLQHALFGGAAAGARAVPVWVPLLVGLVALGHLFSGLRGRRCGLWELAPLPRAVAYVVVVALVVLFNPGATKSFIYFQF